MWFSDSSYTQKEQPVERPCTQAVRGSKRSSSKSYISTAACVSESLEVPSADSVSPALPDVCVQRVCIVHGSCVPALLSLVHLHPALGSLHAPDVAPNSGDVGDLESQTIPIGLWSYGGGGGGGGGLYS